MIFTYPIPPHEGIELPTALTLAAPAHNGNPGFSEGAFFRFKGLYLTITVFAKIRLFRKLRYMGIEAVGNPYDRIIYRFPRLIIPD